MSILENHVTVRCTSCGQVIPGTVPRFGGGQDEIACPRCGDRIQINIAAGQVTTRTMHFERCEWAHLSEHGLAKRPTRKEKKI